MVVFFRWCGWHAVVRLPLGLSPAVGVPARSDTAYGSAQAPGAYVLQGLQGRFTRDHPRLGSITLESRRLFGWHQGPAFLAGQRGVLG